MWQNVFQSLVSWFPLQIAKNQMPFVLQPQLGASNSSGNPLVLASAATGQITFQVPSDCVIEIDQWNAWSSLSSTNPTSLGFLANIWYGNGDVQLTQGPVPGELIFGTAQMPGRWGYRPWIITRPAEQAFGQLTIQCTNTMGATNTIYFALMGFRHKLGGPS